MSSLSAYRKNLHSQNGEDGVLQEICARLGLKEGFFVEFGAWDGMHLSNTFRLLEDGWSGVYIEADTTKFQDLTRNMKTYSGRVELINAFVEPEGKNRLDNLLLSTKAPQNFEVLSIDIDSCDWQIWHSLQNYSPLIVVVEINSYIPVGIFQTHRGRAIQGSSFTSTLDLGNRKGYTAVCHTGNLIFVRNSHVSKLRLPESEILFPETLFDYSWKALSYEPAIVDPVSRILRRLKRVIGKR